MKNIRLVLLASLLLLFSPKSHSRENAFNVIAFFTARNDLAHISFVKEANNWFPEMAARYKFHYDTTSNWSNLNPEFLARYQVVIFLDTRPEDPKQREAFMNYMKNGGAWMGFHFAGFALTPSEFPQDWDWYHNQFLGSGSYVSNTWRPTSAILRVEDPEHPITNELPITFKSAPNEWYQWSNDLRKNPDIRILLSIDSASFPLGTGPKPHEIWHSGFYPVAWTNKNYRMVYFNMGHNDMDYEGKTNKQLSSTFGSPFQDRLILDALFWLGRQPAPYQPSSQEMYDTIYHLDSLLFDAYNRCDLTRFASFISDSIEFYHDRTGLMNSKAEIVEAIKKNICGKVTRELVEGSLEVYPINNYGAIEIGLHRFHNLVENSVSKPDKFIQLWRNLNGKWQLTRIFSMH